MSEDRKPGWLLRRVFGTKEEAWPPEPVPVQAPDPKPQVDPQPHVDSKPQVDAKAAVEAAPGPVTPPRESPASPSEGQPDFATAAADVSHIPLPASEPSAADPDRNAVPDEIEGADLQPIAGAEERSPAGTAGDDPKRGAEAADTTSRAFAPLPDPEPEVSAQIFMPEAGAEPDGQKRGWWSRLTGA